MQANLSRALFRQLDTFLVCVIQGMYNLQNSGSMARLHGPLFSEKAQKQLGHNLIYKRKGNRSLLTKYNKPGGASPFNPSPGQINQRMLYNLVIANWQVKNPAEKAVFNDLVKEKNLKMSGWNYFLQAALADLPTYLGLQGYWAFNQIVGGKVLDLSGNGNDATPKPLYPSNYPNLVDSINGKFGKAGSFDGIDDRFHCGLGTNLEITGPLTISIWAKRGREDQGIHELLIWKAHWAVGVYAGYWLDFRQNNTLLFWLGDGVNAFSLATLETFTTDIWYNIVCVFDPPNMSIYVNGALSRTTVGGPAQIGIPPAEEFTIGYVFPVFEGLLDEVRVYTRALELPEIKKLYDLVS